MRQLLLNFATRFLCLRHLCQCHHPNPTPTIHCAWTPSTTNLSLCVGVLHSLSGYFKSVDAQSRGRALTLLYHLVFAFLKCPSLCSLRSLASAFHLHHTRHDCSWWPASWCFQIFYVCCLSCEVVRVLRIGERIVSIPLRRQAGSGRISAYIVFVSMCGNDCPVFSPCHGSKTMTDKRSS